MSEDPTVGSHVGLVRAGLAAVAASYLVVGLWALAQPRSFYDGFPGGGRAWVAADGPFNEHLLRDFGALNLALTVMLLGAALWPTLALVRVASVAALVWATPHLAYHLANLDPLPHRSDRVANVVVLSLAVVVPALTLLATTRRPQQAAPAPRQGIVRGR